MSHSLTSTLGFLNSPPTESSPGLFAVIYKIRQSVISHKNENLQSKWIANNCSDIIEKLQWILKQLHHTPCAWAAAERWFGISSGTLLSILLEVSNENQNKCQAVSEKSPDRVYHFSWGNIHSVFYLPLLLIKYM